MSNINLSSIYWVEIKEIIQNILEELEQYEVFSKDKAIMCLVDYKMARFSNEIFKKMGINIIDRIDQGFIVSDNGLYKN